MLHSLRFRLLLTLIVVVAVAVGTVALLASRVTSSELQRYVELDMQRNQHVIDTLLAYYNQNQGSGDTRAMAHQMQQIVGERVILTDSAGKVMSDSDEQLVGQQLGCDMLVSAVIVTAGRSPCVAMQAFGPISDQPLPDPTDKWNQIESAPAQPADNILFLGVPRPNIREDRNGEAGSASGAEPFQSAGITIIRARGPGFDPIATGFISAVNRSLLLAVVAAGLAVLLLTVALSRRILGPVEALTAAARAMEKGDLSRRVTVASKDEIGELAHAFNAMADGLARIEQLRRHMVTDVAHELRTPLTNIRGYLEALRDGVAAPAPALLDSLHEEALLLNHLVDDLQDLALAEAGQLRLARRPVPLGAIVEQAVSALHPSLADKNLTIGIELPADLPCMDADGERVGQVLRNLLNNAITHTPHGGSIVVEAEYIADCKLQIADYPQAQSAISNLQSAILVRVRDSGAGITAEHLSLIFERFFRADPSRARATGGAGLGLTIVKQLVEAHGGRVWTESAAGAGATFAFTLPVAESRDYSQG